MAAVTPIQKKMKPHEMKNYPAVSVIPIVSKLFERKMYDQILFTLTNIFTHSYLGIGKGTKPRNA